MLTIAAVISVLGVVIAGMLAYNYNRSVIGYVLLSLVLTPVLTIVTLLVLGERNINFMINDKRDQVTPEPEKVIPEEQEELKVEVQMQVNVHNALDETDPKVNNMHDDIKKSLYDLYIMKKTINSILADQIKQVRNFLSKKLIGAEVKFHYNKNVVVYGVIRRVVIISDQTIYVEVEYDGKLSQLSTEDLTFL